MYHRGETRNVKNMFYRRLYCCSTGTASCRVINTTYRDNSIYEVYSSIIRECTTAARGNVPYPPRRRRLVSTPAPPPAAPSVDLSELLPCPPPLALLRPSAPLQRDCRSCRRHAPTDHHRPSLAPRTDLRCCCPLCCCWMEILAYEP